MQFNSFYSNFKRLAVQIKSVFKSKYAHQIIAQNAILAFKSGTDSIFLYQLSPLSGRSPHQYPPTYFHLLSSHQLQIKAILIIKNSIAKYFRYFSHFILFSWKQLAAYVEQSKVEKKNAISKTRHKKRITIQLINRW